MIELKYVSKTFQDTPALTRITAQIQDGLIFGLVGSNGAGKSTLLRLISGILMPEEGEVTLDGSPIFEHPDVKKQICFLSAEKEAPDLFQGTEKTGVPPAGLLHGNPVSALRRDL